MDKILILGAGIYQVPLIKKAKEMGLYTIVASVEGNYPGFNLADKVYYANTIDINLIKEIARNEKITAICTTGTDVAVQTIGAVCDELGLCGISEESAKIATNKLLMKEAFNKGNVRSAEFVKVSTIEEAKKGTMTIGLPVMFKAVDSSGSRGIIKVENYEDIEKAFKYSKENTRKNYIIIEKFIQGSEIGVDAFVVDNEIQLLLPHNKLVYNNGDTDVPLGHSFPYECSESLLNDIKEQVTNVIKSVGFNNCAVNMDVLINEDKAYVIEAGGRAGATCIPELISIHCGFNYYEKMIKCALGEHVDFEVTNYTPCAARLITSNSNGIIKEINIEKYKLNKSIDISFDYGIGDNVNKFRVGPDRIGQIIVQSESLDSVLKTLIKVSDDEKLIIIY